MSPSSSWKDLSNCTTTSTTTSNSSTFSSWLFELTCRVPNEKGEVSYTTTKLVSSYCTNNHHSNNTNDDSEISKVPNESSSSDAPLLDPLLSSMDVNFDTPSSQKKNVSGWSFSRIGNDNDKTKKIERNHTNDNSTDNNTNGGCWGMTSENNHILTLTYRTTTTTTGKNCVFREIYNLEDDVLRVEKIENSNLSIPGCWSCPFHMVRIFLRSKKDQSSIRSPPTFSDENQSNIIMDSHNLPLPPWCTNENEYNDSIYGPIVIFALPSSSTLPELQQQEQPYAPPPALLWKVQIPPLSENDDMSLLLESITMLDAKLNYSPMMTDPTHIYINGYQSWSFAGTVKRAYTQPTSAMPNVFSKAFNDGGTIPSSIKTNNRSLFECCKRLLYTKSKKKERQSLSQSNDEQYREIDYNDLAFYTSDFFTCVTSSLDHYNSWDENGVPALILGWLSQHNQFGLITADQSLERFIMHCSLGDDGIHLAARKNKRQTHNFVQTDWGYCQLIIGKNNNAEYDEEPLAHYLSAAAAYNRARPFVVDQYQEPSVGWCSWYHYYDKIDANTLIDNFQRLNKLRSHISPNLAIIDDGYMTAWGDWDSLKPKQFADDNCNGAPVLKVLADGIRNSGMKPGIWLAPFACDKHSIIAKQHPDWIIRNHSGRPSNSSNCGKFFYGLDATNPAVREHAYCAVRRAVQEWGYETLKLDFLYAACLTGTNKYDPSLSRAETMQLALKTLREAAGPTTFLIGCGCPLGSAIGIVDGMRVSADTGPTFYPEFPLPKWDNGTLPSLRAMIRNSLTRSGMGHRWWHNDPDCVLLGETTKLNDFEVISAATIVAMTGGMMLLSDDLTKLSDERLKIGTRIYPVTGTTAVPMDLHCPRMENSNGLPNLLKFWCIDSIENNGKGDVSDTLNSCMKSPQEAVSLKGYNADALHNARCNSYSDDQVVTNPNERIRTCLRVAKGLGIWSVVSLSNWQDKPAVINVPMKILTTFPKTSDKPWSDNSVINGYHVFAFWSSTYLWLPNSSKNQPNMLSKRLFAHESEIFHVKAVKPNEPQYIGSDIHFSCGYEIKQFTLAPHTMVIKFKNYYKRSGFIYIYVPFHGNKREVQILFDNEEQVPSIMCSIPFLNDDGSSLHNAGRVMKIWVEIPGNCDEDKAILTVTY